MHLAFTQWPQVLHPIHYLIASVAQGVNVRPDIFLRPQSSPAVRRGKYNQKGNFNCSLYSSFADLFSRLPPQRRSGAPSHAAEELCLLVLELLTGDHSIGLELLEDYDLGCELVMRSNVHRQPGSCRVRDGGGGGGGGGGGIVKLRSCQPAKETEEKKPVWPANCSGFANWPKPEL